MIIEKDNFFVLTGGPGSGKSSIVDALMRRGVCCIPEAGRDIIKEQLRIGGSALPMFCSRSRVALAAQKRAIMEVREASASPGIV